MAALEFFSCLCGCGEHKQKIRDQRFFSRSCYNKWRRDSYIKKDPITFHCAYCGQLSVKRPAGRGKLRFCSDDHRIKYYGERVIVLTVPRIDGTYIVVVSAAGQQYRVYGP